jgi:hypothetical protein
MLQDKIGTFHGQLVRFRLLLDCELEPHKKNWLLCALRAHPVPRATAGASAERQRKLRGINGRGPARSVGRLPVYAAGTNLVLVRAPREACTSA